MTTRSLRIRFAAPVAALAAMLASSGVAMAATPTPSASPSASPSPSPVGVWRQQNTPTEEHLHGIFAYDSCHVWAVGEEAGDNNVNPVAQAVVIASTDGGKTWSSQSFPPLTANLATMNRVFFTDATHGYAVGENNGTFVPPSAAPTTAPTSSASASPTPVASGRPNVFSTTDGGKNWKDISANLPNAAVSVSGDNGDVEGLTAVGDKVWLAESNNSTGQLLYSSDRGQTWTTQKSITNGGFAAVSMFDANNGFAVSDYFGDGSGGNLWRTINGGQDWVRGIATAKAPEQVWATGTTSAVIAEEQGVAEYTSNGTSLTSSTMPVAVGTTDLTDVAFGSASVGVATGELNGSLLESSDGGKTWTLTPANAGDNNFNGATVARGTNVGFVTGESGRVAGNTDPTVGCVASAQLPAAVVPASATPKLPAAGLGADFSRPLWLAIGVVLLLGLGVAGRLVAQRIGSRA